MTKDLSKTLVDPRKREWIRGNARELEGMRVDQRKAQEKREASWETWLEDRILLPKRGESTRPPALERTNTRK
jgi:hypothetical protein